MNIFETKFNLKKYTPDNMGDNPKEVADFFVEKMKKEGYLFDYSLHSLEVEIDKFLKRYSYIKGYKNILDIIFKNRFKKRQNVETFLTAYIGETLINLYSGQWIGSYFGPENPFGSNFYTSYIKINNFEFNPNHFIAYYLNNGRKEEGTFYEYLYSRNQSEGFFFDFLGGGLINMIENKKNFCQHELCKKPNI